MMLSPIGLSVRVCGGRGAHRFGPVPRLARLAVVAILAFVGGTRWAAASDAEDAATVLRSAENAKVTADVVDMPLSELLALLRDQSKLEIRTHRRTLEQTGVDGNSPCTLRVRDLSLATTLDRVTARLRLAWVVRPWGIELTSHDHSHSVVFTRNWDLDKMLGITRDVPTAPAAVSAAPTAGPGVTATIAPSAPRANHTTELLDAIRLAAIPGESWDIDGGNASASLGPSGLLTVTATTRTLASVDQLLQSLRAARQQNTNHPARGAAVGNPAAVPLVVSFPARGERARTLRAALEQRTTIDFVTAPLPDVLEFLANRHKLDFVLDEPALEGAGIAPTVPVTLALRDAKVRHVLDCLLDDLGLAAVVGDNAVYITTGDRKTLRGQCRVYPLADLLAAGDPNAQSVQLKELSERIVNHVAPRETWEEHGGMARRVLLFSMPSIVVAADSDVHDRIEQLLVEWRSLPTDRPLFPVESDDKAIASRIYTIASLLGPLPEGDSVKPKQIVELLKSELHDAPWNGPDYSIHVVGKLIVVRHTQATHRKITLLSIERQAGTR
jgi:hypothetical protein